MSPEVMGRLLSDSSPSAVLVDALLIVSHLARNHNHNFNTYDTIAEARIYGALKRCAPQPGKACLPPPHGAR
jgi:hypothetical protein